MIPVKSYDIISLHGFELSNQIDCNNLVGPIGLHVIFSLTPGIKFGGKNCFADLSTLSCTSTWWLD